MTAPRRSAAHAPDADEAVVAGMHRRDVTVLFADLAGYTALTEAHGDVEAARAAARLQDLARRAVTEAPLLVKGLGDGILMVFGRPVDAVIAALALSRAAADQDRYPALRIGLDTGPAIEHDGDYFGTTLNVAARLADAARPGQVLATTRIRDSVPDDPDGRWAFVDPRQVRLRNLREPVTAVEVRDVGSVRDMSVDPVCRMRVTADAPDAVDYQDGRRTIRFCSQDCARQYAEHPGRYV